MKKYLTVAAVLGAIAFVSVSFLAQANEPVAATTSVEVTTEAAPAVAVDAAVDAVAKECETSVAASFEGKTPSDEEKAAALKACVDGKAAEAKVEVAPAAEGAAE